MTEWDNSQLRDPSPPVPGERERAAVAARAHQMGAPAPGHAGRGCARHGRRLGRGRGRAHGRRLFVGLRHQPHRDRGSSSTPGTTVTVAPTTIPAPVTTVHPTTATPPTTSAPAVTADRGADAAARSDDAARTAARGGSTATRAVHGVGQGDRTSPRV